MSASTPEVVPTTSLAGGGKREREEEDGSAPDEMMMPTCAMRTEEEPQQQPDVDDADNHHGCTAEEEHDDDDASQLLAEAARRVAELEAEEDSAVELFSFKYRLALHEAGIITKYMAMGEAWCTTHASAEEVEAAPSSSNMCDVSSATAALSVASAELHAAITTAELTNHVLQHTLIIIGGSTPPSMTPCATDLVECLQELRTAAHAEVPPPPSSSSSYATASSSSSSSRAELLRFISQTIEVSKQLSGVLSVVAHDPIIHQAMTNMQTELQRISEGLLRLSQQRQRGVEQREKVHEHLRSYIITAGECSLLAAQRRLLDQVGLMSSREVMQEQVEVVQNKLLRRRLHHFGTLLVAKHLAQRTEGMSMMLPLMNASTPTMDGSFRDAEARVASLEGLRDGLMKEMLLLRRRCVLEFGSDPLLNTNNEDDEDHRQLYGGQVVLHRAVLAEVLRGCHDTLASVLAEVGVAGASSTYSSMVARLLKSREAIASRQHSLAAQLAANCSLAHNNNTAALLMQPSATATTTPSSSSSASLPNTNTNNHHLLRMQDSILRDYHQCMEKVVRVAEAMMAQLHLRCHQPHQYMVDEVLQLVQHVGAADTLQLAQIDAAPAFPEALPALVKELMSVDCGGIRAMQQLVSTTHHDDDDDDQPRTYSVLLPALPTSSQEEVLPTFARARDNGAQAEEAQRWADDADAITAMTAQLEWLSRINISDAPERLAAEEAEVEELRARLKVACAATAQSHILHQRHAAAVAALATITNVAKPDLVQRIAAHEEELRRLQQANEALEEARRAKEAEAQAAAEAAETLAKEQAEAAAAAAQVAEDDVAPVIGDALVDDVPMFADEDAVEGPIMEEDAVDAPQHDDDPDAEGPQQDEENEEAELEDGEEDEEEEEEQQMSSFHSFPTEDEVTDVVVDAVNDGVLDEEVPPATTMDPTNSSINTSGATFLSFPSDDVNPFASGFGFDEDEE